MPWKKDNKSHCSVTESETVRTVFNCNSQETLLQCKLKQLRNQAVYLAISGCIQNFHVVYR